jgi:hypothetical protein
VYKLPKLNTRTLADSLPFTRKSKSIPIAVG